MPGWSSPPPETERGSTRVGHPEPLLRLSPREAGEHGEWTGPARRPQGPELRGPRDVRHGAPRPAAPAFNSRTLRYPLELSVGDRERLVGKQPVANGRPFDTVRVTLRGRDGRQRRA